MDSESEPKLISLISELVISLKDDTADSGSSIISLMIQVISVVRSMDLKCKAKPESQLMSLVTQAISVFQSMDLDSQPEQLSKLISIITRKISVVDSEFLSLYYETSKLDPRPELISIISQIVSLFPILRSLTRSDEVSDLLDISPVFGQIVSLIQSLDLDSPQTKLKVELVQGKFHVTSKVERKSKGKGECQRRNQQRACFVRGGGGEEEATHFLCKDCNGEDHEQCQKTLVEVKHPLHPKHSLQLVSHRRKSWIIQARKCFCCDDDLEKIFYYCEACDFAMNIVCTDIQPVLSIDHPKWHEHTLSLFPRRAFLTCNVCALSDARSPIYMCPPCDFVVHLRCINLPRVLRISRHPHRMSFTPSFFGNQGDWSCGICRREIDNDYGGYSCIKNGCSYASHLRCATQSNVWDGEELDGVPEDVEEEVVEPFLQISDGIIQHFSHQQHHLRLDENTGGDYDDNIECQACIMPIYFGKFYSCLQCDFILHEACANLSRKIHHPIHPHLLTLVEGCDGVIKYEDKLDNCSACPWPCVAGFFYECSKEGCSFKLHVQCATVSEPLVQESHKDPLFLTSKPGEQRACSVCREARLEFTNETFNCIECEFSLCFGCATLPQKVRYKHDKHTLTLSFGEDTSTMTYWCEACERKINRKERFYKCDEYCCNTLHIECLIGKDFYMKPGSCFDIGGIKIAVLRNNHMSRPFCFGCRKRCPYKILLEDSRLKFCSRFCKKLE
ncbi:hypothetical protein EUTSA_v10003369mg [Eutrema salsugineum]|uniref:Phorbol-ester/DAG-type domain-containing protein n=1 Tax=Eutrema salsugineum TaxID=72664 RepID=V4LLM8_EUTSA|nr:hypothetical protein EUTSA_v10003369mg [Eutrema salsugineum]